MQRIVCSALLNKIYLADINKDGITMSSKRRDVTDEAISAVFEHFEGRIKEEGGNEFLFKSKKSGKTIMVKIAHWWEFDES